MTRFNTAMWDRLRWIASAKSSSSAIIQTGIGRVGLLAVTFACGILTARNLGPVGRGDQAAMAMWPQFLAFASTFGIQSALIFHARKHQTDRDSLVTASLVWSVILGLCATAIGIIFMPLWLSRYSPETIDFARTLMFLSPMVMLGVTMNAIFETRFDFAASNIIRYAMPVFTLIMLVALVATHRLTPKLSAIAYTVPGLIVLFAMFPTLLKTFTFTFTDFKRSTRRLFGYGIRVYGNHMLGTFSGQIDQVLVVNLLTAGNLGLYTVALSISRTLAIFQTSLAIVVLPKAAGMPDDRVASIVGCAARLNLIASGAAGILLASVLPILLPKIYGHDFRSAVIVTQLLVIEAVISSTVGVLIQAFMATNRPAVPTVFQAFGLALAIPFMLVFIPRFGIIGAAMALLLSSVTRMTFALISFPKLLRQPMPSLILKRSDISFAMNSIRRKVSSEG